MLKSKVSFSAFFAEILFVSINPFEGFIDSSNKYAEDKDWMLEEEFDWDSILFEKPE